LHELIDLPGDQSRYHRYRDSPGDWIRILHTGIEWSHVTRMAVRSDDTGHDAEDPVTSGGR
jgi:hypothetical protein